jgi:hypothetical protein
MKNACISHDIDQPSAGWLDSIYVCTKYLNHARDDDYRTLAAIRYGVCLAAVRSRYHADLSPNIPASDSGLITQGTFRRICRIGLWHRYWVGIVSAD